MKQVLFATGNPSKAKRFSKGLKEKGIEVITLKDINVEIEVEENGKNAIENALLKARAYSKVVDIPVFAMDDNLYLENVPDEKQPGMFVRRVDGKRLSDDEMIEHYIQLVKEYGTDGKLTCRWVYGMAIINNGKESTYTWSKEDFYMVDKPSNKMHTGYPLDTISINKKLNKYFTDITEEDKAMLNEDESDVVEFIFNNAQQKELAVAIQNENEEVNIIETINSIKNANFKNVFIQWYDDENWQYSQEEQLNLCKKLGLNIIFAHLGYQNINSIWAEGTEGDSLVDRYKNDIKNCKENGISLVVMHLTSKKDAPMYGETGLNRIKKITQYAKELGVRVAFENTKIKGYLEYVLGNIKDENVGICFDSGHYHVHFNDEFNFEFFKDRIFAVHLHDNDKSGDLHLLPFDGTIDWKYVMKKLEECNYKGPITMELCYRYDYLKLPLDEFYKMGYERGIELSKL